MYIKEIIELLENWDNFKRLNPNDNIYDFGKWLSESGAGTVNKSPILKSGKHLTDEYSGEYQFLASYFITRMGKFIKNYTKEIFSEYELNSSDDFSFLALIDTMENPNKKELCAANLTEFSTGLDIIRKLIKKGYVVEIQNPSDKRAKILKITEKGKLTVDNIYNKLRQLTDDVLGDLNAEERTTIIRFLERLNTYHTNNINQNK